MEFGSTAYLLVPSNACTLAGEAEALGGGGDLGFLDELDAFKASGDSAPSNLNATYEFKKGVLKYVTRNFVGVQAFGLMGLYVHSDGCECVRESEIERHPL